MTKLPVFHFLTNRGIFKYTIYNKIIVFKIAHEKI